MESIGELISLLGGILLLSGFLGAAVAITGGPTDVSHLMLPDDIMDHLSKAWGNPNVEAADLSPDGCFKLRVQIAAGEERELLLQRMIDGLTSCMYDPLWQLPGSASYTWSQEDSGPNADSGPDARDVVPWLADIIETQAQDLGIRKEPEESTTFLMDYSLHLPNDELEAAKFTLDLSSASDRMPLWSGKGFLKKHYADRQSNELRQSLAAMVKQLFEMMATRKTSEDDASPAAGRDGHSGGEQTEDR